MASSEFIFGPLDAASIFARKKRWRPSGRASWLKPDGTCVHLLAFEEQLAAISKGERVYVVGKLTLKCSRALKRIGATVVQA